jgi:hypothetical protein
MWSPLERSRDHMVETQARQLVGECESFLVGEYPALLQHRGLPIPEWAWLSVLAHAPVDVLVQHARGGSRERFRGHLHAVWLGAVALLAQELVIVAERAGCRVEDLQHDVLLGVELGWAPPAPGASTVGPSRFVEEVRQALHRFRGSSHAR